MEIDGLQTPRMFISAKTLEGVPALRERLALIAALNVSKETPVSEIPKETSAIRD
jgi:hypothetical protein